MAIRSGGPGWGGLRRREGAGHRLSAVVGCAQFHSVEPDEHDLGH